MGTFSKKFDLFLSRMDEPSRTALLPLYDAFKANEEVAELLLIQVDKLDHTEGEIAIRHIENLFKTYYPEHPGLKDLFVRFVVSCMHQK